MRRQPHRIQATELDVHVLSGLADGLLFRHGCATVFSSGLAVVKLDAEYPNMTRCCDVSGAGSPGLRQRAWFDPFLACPVAISGNEVRALALDFGQSLGHLGTPVEQADTVVSGISAG